MEWQAFLEQIDKRSFDAHHPGWSMSRDPTLSMISSIQHTRKGEYNFNRITQPEGIVCSFGQDGVFQRGGTKKSTPIMRSCRIAP